MMSELPLNMHIMRVLPCELHIHIQSLYVLKIIRVAHMKLDCELLGLRMMPPCDPLPAIIRSGGGIKREQAPATDSPHHSDLRYADARCTSYSAHETGLVICGEVGLGHVDDAHGHRKALGVAACETPQTSAAQQRPCVSRHRLGVWGTHGAAQAWPVEPCIASACHSVVGASPNARFDCGGCCGTLRAIFTYH